MDVSYHLINIKFKRLTTKYGEGRKLKITYQSTKGKTIKVIYEDDNDIFLDDIREIVNAVYGKGTQWKNVTENLKRALCKNPSPDKKTLLVNGYSYKFIKKLFPYFESKYNLLLDTWSGSKKHNKKLSEYQLNRSDFIFCEWCLGNAVWYSKNKLPHQKLVIRLHRWETKTDNWKKIKWDNVDAFICISPYFVDFMREKLPSGVNILYIPNYIDPTLFLVQKTDDAKYNMGMLGYTPKLKNPINAIDFFDNFKKTQSDGNKYKLYFKGVNPTKHEDLKEKPEEVRYYDRFFKIVKGRKDIIVEDFSSDVASWFNKIGYILSFSDVEGSHQAIAEGMSSGCIPYLQGKYVENGHAKGLYPDLYCEKEIVLYSTTESERMREYFKENIIDNIGLQISKLF